MSAVLTLQNALDLPSPVTLHFEHPDFELDCPHSPTSSLKGVFVRSRPSSMDFSSADAPDLLSQFQQFGMTGNTQVPFIQAPPASRMAGTADILTRPRATISRDDCTVRSTASSSTTPVRAVRRVLEDDETDDEDDDEDLVPPTDGAGTTTRRRTWPSMEGLRSRVSGIFHRKQLAYAPMAPPPPTPADREMASVLSTTEITHATPATLPRRTFSFSLRSRSRTSSVSSTKLFPPAVNIAARTRRVRRSRSFSGFTSMAQQVLAAIADADTEDFDDVALEAFNTVRGIGQFWMYEEDEAEVAAGVLERGVERP
ncbi:hypothetical protein B0H17DRAFT_1207449 [Mycena rosella]|uniref:Uncharacterized protein n=1 Tax=Mycena rosella TaxID=1033263 RepID=A0AAD7D3C4_MYCRO|nr:hypothetical protein B0H17DRAFT_1207449 [Mycena rosella]